MPLTPEERAERGRPKLPRGKGKTDVVTVRMSRQGRAAIGKAAEKTGETLSTWIRNVLLQNKPRPAQPAISPAASVWVFSEAGGTVKLETDQLPRELWERLKQYVDDVLEPSP